MLKYNKNCNFITSSFFLNKSSILAQLSEGNVVFLNEVNSTNQYIIDNILYVNSGDACVTEHQTQGRGRRGKIWITSFGKSICLSIYWKLDKLQSPMITFSLMVSIIIAKILKHLGVSQIQIKWPNDLYVHGRKLAGILIEVITGADKITHIIIGIGINISVCTYSVLKDNINKNWIGLQDIGVMIDYNTLIVILINTLRRQLKDFVIFGFAPFISYWNNFDYLYNKPIALSIGDQVIYGTALGVNIHGALIIKQADIIQCYLGDDISIAISL